jgi:SAM-dependent methyltransferase
MDTFWTSEKLENYKRASEYTAFHKRLAVLAEPYLDENWTLADLGCGPGLIDFYFAPMVASITAIDNDVLALDDLQARLDDVFQTNKYISDRIAPQLGDIRALTDEAWDVVLLSFFGVDKALLDDVLPRARKRALLYTHGRHEAYGSAPLPDDNGNGKFDARDIEAYLDANHYAYKKNVLEMQFGQPFKTIEDIHTFLGKYGEGNQELSCIDLSRVTVLDDDAIKRMTDAEERIVKTDRFDYPYYLPKSLSVALFIVVMNTDD